jgi:hypothetical protein
MLVGSKWALQAATPVSLRGASVTREGIRLGTAAPEALARRGPQPERGYNKADGGGVPSCHRGD